MADHGISAFGGLMRVWWRWVAISLVLNFGWLLVVVMETVSVNWSNEVIDKLGVLLVEVMMTKWARAAVSFLDLDDGVCRLNVQWW